MITNAGPEDRMSGVRKAAVLVVLMGPDVSGEVMRNLSDVKGGVKVSHRGGGKGDPFFLRRLFPSAFGGGWSGALRRPLGRRV